MNHMNFLETIAMGDVDALRTKEKTYKGSWKKRGGVGAFMMLARKWDRLEGILEQRGAFGGGDKDAQQYDIFKWIECEKYEDALNGTDGTVLAEVRDLRRYLLLVEAEMIARNTNAPGTPEDGGHHARKPFED